MGSLSSLQVPFGIFAETYRSLKIGRDLKKNPHPGQGLSELKTKWAQDILNRLQIQLAQQGSPSEENPLLLVGNHISYLDIVLLLKTVPEISFVAKGEIASWPLFGSAARLIDTIFIQRECRRSRGSAREAIKTHLKESKRIVIFPSGTTCLDETKSWRRGVFEIAAETGVRIQPFRINYSPLRTAAYIDRDFFPAHLHRLSQTSNVKARIEFHEPVVVENPSWDCRLWQEWTKNGHSPN